mgnify:CR=1 FL=1
MKKCRKCGIEKPLTAEYYHKHTQHSSGFNSHCKVCKAEYYQNNKERALKYAAEYRQNNKEAIAKTNAEYRQNNKERALKYHAEYYQNNKEKIAEYQQNNKERILKRHAEYRIQKKAEQPACVYQIVNSVNNKIYIGETTRGELRWKEHLKDLRGKYHTNHKLQADFDKFGEEVFSWSIIEEYPKDKDTLLLEEIKAIDKLLREGKELYNLSLTIDQLKLLMESK